MAYMSHVLAPSNLGNTGRIKFPKDESCVMKYPNELALAC